MTNSGNRKLIRAMSSNEGLEHKFGTKLKHHTINMNDGMPNSDSLKMSITPINNTSKMHGANGGFVAPMRGRGFGRGTGTNRGDMFRSRQPNTSRPPSMHVDDYIKMEMQGSSSSVQPPSIPPLSSQPRRLEVQQFCLVVNATSLISTWPYRRCNVGLVEGKY